MNKYSMSSIELLNNIFKQGKKRVELLKNLNRSARTVLINGDNDLNTFIFTKNRENYSDYSKDKNLRQIVDEETGCIYILKNIDNVKFT